MKAAAVLNKLIRKSKKKAPADPAPAAPPLMPEAFDPKQLDPRYGLDTQPVKPNADNDTHDPELKAAKQKTKRKLPSINLSHLFSESFALLAFQTGSFGLRGCLIRNERFQARIVSVAESSNIDFTRAIAEVLNSLKKEHKRLPKKAILLTPNVVSDVISLPVSPLRPRSDEQMQELIRWELEGAVTQQNKHWLLGSMLVERGYLSVNQRDEIVTELQIRQAQGGQAAMTRFGELAVQLGYISREQLEECFALQGKLVAVDDDLVYGWQAEENLAQGKDQFRGLTDEILLSQADDENSSHRWLVSGISKTVRQRWIGAFNLNNLQLEAFYPSVGANFATLSQLSNHPVQMLLEVQQEQIACISGTPQGITNIQLVGRHGGDQDLADCMDVLGVLPSDLKQLHLCTPTADCDGTALKAMLETKLPQEIIPLQAEGLVPELITELKPQALLGILGAANHFLKHTPQPRLSWISARNAERNLWKTYTQPRVLISALLITLGLLMVGSVAWLYTEKWYQQERLAELNAKYDRQLQLKKQFEQITSGESELKEKIDLAVRELRLTDNALHQAQVSGIRERNVVLTVLKSIGITISPGVQLVSIQQKTGTFTLKARAETDTEALEFVTLLNTTLHPINYQVFNSQMRRAQQKSATRLPYQLTITLDSGTKE